MSQLLVLVLINIAFGLASGGGIDNAAHLGGLAAGLWLGALVPPTGVPTLSSLWNRPGLPRGYVIVLGLAVVGIVVVAGIAFGTNDRSNTASTAVLPPAASAAAARLEAGQPAP